MQGASITEGPIEIFRKLLSATKSVVTAQNKLSLKHLDEHFLQIDEDIGDILSAFQEFESWKNKLTDEFERRIQIINDSSRLSPEFDHLIKNLRSEVHETKRKVGNYLPQLGFVWAIRKKGQDGGNRGTSTKMKNLAKRKYEGLDKQLQSCFLCCSVFPSDFIIKRRGLINWWIGEGFVYPKEGKTAQQVGEECFEELLKIGLVESLNKKGSSNNFAKSCKINPNIRSVSISIAKESRFFDFNSKRESTGWSPHQILRSSFISAQESQNRPISVSPPSDYIQLISLLNLDGQYVKFDRDINYRLSKLVVLQLGQWPAFNGNIRPVKVGTPDVFIKFLLSLKRLRYLGLRGVYGINELPDNIDELTELLVLDLRACHDLKRLPSSIGKLRKLTYLDVSQCYMVDYIPSSIQDLDRLEVLEGLVLAHSSERTDPANLSHLVKLKMLTKLSISFGVKAKISESQLKDAKFLEGLRAVTILWQRDSNGSRDKHCPSMNLDWLPSCLEKLDLRCFPKETTPIELTPMNFTNLKRLYFRGGSMLSLNDLYNEDMPWKIETLRLRYMKSLYVDSVSGLQGQFPHMNSVEILGCPKISKLRGLWIRDNVDWVRHSLDRPSSVDMAEATGELDNFSTERYKFSYLGKATLRTTSYETDLEDLAERGTGYIRRFFFERLLRILVFLYTCGRTLTFLGTYFIPINLYLIPLIVFGLVVRENALRGLGILLLTLMLFFYHFLRVMAITLFQRVRSGMLTAIGLCFLLWLATSARIVLGLTVIVVGTFVGAATGYRLQGTLDVSAVGMASFVIYIFLLAGHTILSGLSTNAKRNVLTLFVLELVHIELYSTFIYAPELRFE